MPALILSALITMTMPTHNVDGTQIPSSEYLIATVWRVGGDVPIEVQLALPGESILVETLQPYGSWYASVFDLNGNESEDTEIVSKVEPGCGNYCHTRSDK